MTTDEGTLAEGGSSLRVLLVLAQLVGLLVVVRMFELENRTVFQVLVLASGGFVVQALLPERFRLSFFAALSVTSVLWVLGFVAGLTVLGIGYLFIAVAHAPIAMRWRVALVVVLVSSCLALRTRVGMPEPLELVWPALGAMFMFRLALYLHSLHHKDASHGIAWSTAYFFMLPNVCFPLFPVVDYTRFVRSHLEGERFRTYDRGITFMLRGVVHLVVYRFVYYDLALDGQYVNNMGDVVRHVVSTFLLYTKVSGQFHLIVGVLCLFGFRLPETNHLYFLAHSITDYWRRANIYWKDFMQKLVYYPSFFRLRRHGNATAVLASTLVVFVVTWLLHSYQFYWLEGTRLLQKRDMAFWGLFAAFALVVTAWDLRPGRQRISKTRRTWSLSRGVATVGTFCLIAVLWSLWSAYSLPTWAFMWSRAQYSAWTDWVMLAAMLLCGVGLAGFGWGAAALEQPLTESEQLSDVRRRGVKRLLAMGGLLVLVWPATATRLPARLQDVLSHFRGDGMAMVEAAIDHVGYYEVLTKPESRAAVRWRRRARPIEQTPYYQARSDFLLDDMVPSMDSVFLGRPFSTNSFGMRDREYQLTKPPSGYRIALMGPSAVFGWGVGDGETFEAVAEGALDSAARRRGQRVELLNFGISGTSLAQEVARVETHVLRFAPDLIVLTAQPYDLAFLQRHFRTVRARGIPIPDTALARLVREAGTDLRPVEEEIDTRLFQWAVEIGRRVGARVAVLGLRMPTEWFEGNLATTRRAAASVGMSFLDCTNVWNGTPATTFRVSGRDLHPNRAGHRVIARCLLGELTRHARDLQIRPILQTSP